MASPEELDRIVLGQYEVCEGIVSEMSNKITRLGYKITPTYIKYCLKLANKETRTFSDVLKEKVEKYHKPVAGNLYIIQEQIARNTVLRPSDYAMRKIMNELGLKVIPRSEEIVKAERKFQPKRKIIRRKELSKEQKSALIYSGL